MNEKSYVVVVGSQLCANIYTFRSIICHDILEVIKVTLAYALTSCEEGCVISSRNQRSNIHI